MLRRPHDESREVVLAIPVHVRHLGGLPADQGHAVLGAGAADAADHALNDAGIEPTR